MLATLLVPERPSPADALARCERAATARWKSFRLWRLAFRPDARAELAALSVWIGVTRSDAPPLPLAELRAELERVIEGAPTTPLGVALERTVRRRELPPSLLRGPLVAREREASLRVFQTRQELEGHAARLVTGTARALLRLLEASTERNELLADALAKGVQLGTWTQDLRGELARGRLRIAVEDLERFQAPLDLETSPTPEPLRRAVQAQTAWARVLYARGWPLCEALGPWRGRLLAGFLRWHAAGLSALEARGFRLEPVPPPAGWLRFVACGVAGAVGSSAPRLD